MRTLILATCAVLFSTATAFSQSFQKIDESPMDCAYFPHNFAHDRKDDEKAIIKVIYSRPAKKGRAIFGKLVPFDKVWRTGANESTEIKLYQDIAIGNQKLSAGTYSLFSIPDTSEWTIIFNSDLDYWGAYSYQKEYDVLRIKAKSTTGKKEVESFSIQFESSGINSGTMKLAWNVCVPRQNGS